ncbi:MAG: aldolase catalytic domain-containing protein [Candidatus Heritagella sp.]
MSQIRLLDCTLRDGGYINDWRFGEAVIRDILENLSQSGMDIIECGFLTDTPADRDCSLFHSPDDIGPLPGNGKNMYVAMIAIGEKETDPRLLPPAHPGGIEGIRLTFHSDEIDKALTYGRIIQEKGYKLFMQPVGSSFYSDDRLLSLILRVNEIQPYAFYIVDTLGCMYARDLQRQLFLADYNLRPGICLGFHSHNNLQLAFSNAQQMIHYKTDRPLLIDCSANGIGRGAGNLCSELIMDYLNKNNGTCYDVLPVIELSDKYLSGIYVSNPWGYSLAYYLSAVNFCHPNYSAYLIAKQTLSAQSIKEILDQIPADKRKRFDVDLIKQLYLSYQKNCIDDSRAIATLRTMLSGRRILVLAPGKNGRLQADRIRDYILQYRPFVISVNFLHPLFPADLCFVTNARRYEQLGAAGETPLLLTSNLAGRNPDALIVNYSSLTNTSAYSPDSAGMMLLKLLVQCGASSAALAGFDGFEPRAQNYLDSRFDSYMDRYTAQQKNAEIAVQLRKRSSELELSFVTDSKYTSMLAHQSA